MPSLGESTMTSLCHFRDASETIALHILTVSVGRCMCRCDSVGRYWCEYNIMWRDNYNETMVLQTWIPCKKCFTVSFEGHGDGFDCLYDCDNIINC